MTRGMSYVCAAFGALICVQSATAVPEYLAKWKLKYPTSTIPARMAVSAGRDCMTCHHSDNFGELGNCYRLALKELLNAGGLSIDAALDQWDGEDSDGDGVANGVEATAPRGDGEVGYNMGLVGPTGTDPCSPDFNPVSNELETPPLVIPAVSEWGMAALTLLVLVVGTLMFRLRVRPSPALIRR